MHVSNLNRKEQPEGDDNSETAKRTDALRGDIVGAIRIGMDRKNNAGAFARHLLRATIFVRALLACVEQFVGELRVMHSPGEDL